MTNKEAKAILEFYECFLKDEKCKGLHIIQNHGSEIDFFFKSGSTTCIAELKIRNKNVTEYNDCLIEVDKFNSLKTVSKTMNAPAFYMCEYNDGVILFYHLDFTKQYDEKSISMRKTTEYYNNEIVMKRCYLLSYNEAIIVSKKTWKMTDAQTLQNYIISKK